MSESSDVSSSGDGVGREVQHLEPVWRDRSDFIIAARLPDATADREQLWARQLSAARFEICCTPFLPVRRALDEIVETASEAGRDSNVSFLEMGETA